MAESGKIFRGRFSRFDFLLRSRARGRIPGMTRGKENVEEISVLGKVFNEVKDQSLEDTSNSLHKSDGETASVLTCHCNRDKKVLT